MAEDLSLKRILIDVARDREDRGEPEKQDYFHPSAMGQCERRVVLAHAGVPGLPMEDQDALYFWIGDVIHDAVQSGISKNLEGQVWNEVGFRDETYKVSGRLDTLRLVRENGEWVVYEYKTQRTDAFRYALPKAEHILQVVIYCIFPLDCPNCVFDHQVPLGLPSCDLCNGTRTVGPAARGKIAYIGKEDGRLEVYDVTPDEELKAAVKQKFMRLQVYSEEYEKNKTLPEKLPRQQVFEKGIPQFYEKSSTKFGFVKGQPKTKPDYRIQNCPYLGSGVCCGDNDAKNEG